MKEFVEFILVLIIIGCIFCLTSIRIKEINQAEFSHEFALKAAELEKENEKVVEENADDSIFVLNEEYEAITTQEDWRLVIASSNKPIHEGYEIPLDNIEENKEFDSRAIEDLQALLKAAKDKKAGNLWAQSAYRSNQRQEELFNNKVAEFVRIGKTQEEAEILTHRVINKPNESEHNLGLAVDFNTVNLSFEKTNVFKWLKENAKEYGFVLRYTKEKEDITGVSYEPWHWRYVGKEHAQKMEELGMCLEEYVEYLK